MTMWEASRTKEVVVAPLRPEVTSTTSVMAWLLPERSQISMFVHVYCRVSARLNRGPTRPRRIRRPGEGLLSAHSHGGRRQRRHGRARAGRDHREERQGLQHRVEGMC